MQWNKTLQIFAAYLSHFTNVIMLLKPMAETFREKGWAWNKSICCCSLKWLNLQAWIVPVLSLSKQTTQGFEFSSLQMFASSSQLYWFVYRMALCYCHVNTFHPKYFFHNKEKAPVFLARVLVNLWAYEFHCKGSGNFFAKPQRNMWSFKREDGHYQNWYKQFNKLQARGDQVCGLGQPCCIYNTIFVLFLCYLLQDYWSKLATYVMHFFQLDHIVVLVPCWSHWLLYGRLNREMWLLKVGEEWGRKRPCVWTPNLDGGWVDGIVERVLGSLHMLPSANTWAQHNECLCCFRDDQRVKKGMMAMEWL